MVSRLTLGLNAAKNIDYIKKCFKQKLFRIKFPKRNSVDAYLYLFQDRARGSKDLPLLKYHNVVEWECRFTLGLEPQKIPIILKNASNIVQN